MLKAKKTLLVLAAAAAAFSFVSCSDGSSSDDEPEKNITESLVSAYVGNTYGMCVGTKIIFKTYEFVSDSEIVYTQIKYGGITAKEYYTYTAAEQDGALVLSCYTHEEGETADTSGEVSTTITINESEDDSVVNMTSSYIERGEEVVSTNDYTVVYSFDDLIGNYYSYKVSGKTITTTYNFIDASHVDCHFVHYNDVTDTSYTYTLSSAHGLSDEGTYDADGEKDLNTYTLNLTDTDGNESTITVVLTNPSEVISIGALATYYGSSGDVEYQDYYIVQD